MTLSIKNAYIFFSSIRTKLCGHVATTWPWDSLEAKLHLWCFNKKEGRWAISIYCLFCQDSRVIILELPVDFLQSHFACFRIWNCTLIGQCRKVFEQNVAPRMTPGWTHCYFLFVISIAPLRPPCTAFYRLLQDHDMSREKILVKVNYCYQNAKLLLSTPWITVAHGGGMRPA